VTRMQLLGEIANDAGLERKDFLATAAAQLRSFLDAHAARLREIGELVLIDDDPDYLAVAADGTFRSRTSYRDDNGRMVEETEVIESPSELVELYNPAEIYAAFAEAARAEAGMAPEPTGAEDLARVAGVAPEPAARTDGRDVYAEAADEWAAHRAGTEPEDEEDAARQLYDLALTFQEQSQESEAVIISRFETSAARLSARLGDLVVVDDDDERLTLRSSGALEAEVVPEDAAGEWRRLATPEELVEFYDPTDIFGDLADSLAEAYPEIAPQDEGAGGSA